MSERFKYLFKNTGLLMIGNFSSKVLVFLLVPFYTRILTTAEYGTYDLLYSTIQLIYPVLTLNIIDGVMRFAVDADRNELKEVFSIGLRLVTVSILSVCIITWIIIYVFRYKPVEEYWIEFVLLYASYGLYNLALQFSKGIEDVKGISIAGVISTVVMIGGNLFFLLVINLGLKGYFYAYILSFFTPMVFLAIRNGMHSYIEKRMISFKLLGIERKMIAYSIPLIFNTLSWSINNVADRYAVTWLCGVDVNGLYSVAYKIPAILNALQIIFIQAWQLSAIKEFDKKDDSFYSQTYNGCHLVMVFLCSVLICSSRILAKLLYANEFYEAWIYVPTLLLYIVFNTLSGAIGGIFGAAKDGKPIAKTAVIGAIINILLNILMVYLWKAEGAAIATVISSIVIWWLRIKASKKYIKLDINWKVHIFTYIFLVAQVVIMSTITSGIEYFFQFAILLTIIFINKKHIKGMIGLSIFKKKA